MRRTITLFLVAFMALGTGMAFASGQNEDRVDRDDQVDREDRDGLTGNLYRLSAIESIGIMGQADEQIGDVDEAVLSLEGQVTHLIVDLRDAQGVENGRYLVPLDAIRIYNKENMALDLQRAQEFQGYDDDSEEQRARQLPEGSVRSSELRGYDVMGQRDEQIASIEDVVVDIETGQVVYIAIASGGFLGLGDAYYAVPFDQVQVVVAEEQIRLALTEDDLAQMEGFDKDNWPAQGQAISTAEIERDGLTGSLYRSSRLEDFGIMGQADEQIGYVVEPVMNLEGKVTHLIVDLNDLEGAESFEYGRYLVPMDAISLYDTENITIDAQRAQEFARFDNGHTPWAGDPRGTSEERMTAGQVSSDSRKAQESYVDPETARDQQLPEGAIRSTDFLRYDVVGPGDNVIAGTEDMVIDLDTGKVVYVAINSGGLLGIGRNYYAISFDRVQVDVAEERFRIDMTEDDLAQLEGFDHGNWPGEGSGRQLSEM